MLLMPAFSGQSKILVYVKMNMYITCLFDIAVLSAQTFPAICDYCQMLQKDMGRKGLLVV